MTTDVTQTEFSYPGDNVTVDWDYVFGITSEEDVKVYVALDGALSSTKISSSLYAVTYDSDTESGSVEYPLSGSPLTTSDKIAVVRETVSKQGTDIKNQINVKGRSLEEGLDNNNRQIQENTNELKRTIKVDVNSSSTPDELLQDIADAVVETQENANADVISAADSAAAAEVAKIEYKGSWSAGTYQINDSVTHGGSSWIALAITTEEPVAVSANWNYLAEGGIDGTNGTNGTDGTDGIDGTNGTNGTDGADGVVQEVIGGTGITVTGTTANPIVNGELNTWDCVRTVIQYVDADSISVVAGKVRNQADTADITVLINADVTDTLSANTTYHVNVDSAGVSTISTSIGTGTNRRIGSFITDSSGDIHPFDNCLTAGGGVLTDYATNPISEFTGTGTRTFGALDVSIPKNIDATGIFIDEGTSGTGTVIITTGSYNYNSAQCFEYRPAFDNQHSYQREYKVGVDSQIKYGKSGDGQVDFETKGYIDERTV